MLLTSYKKVIMLYISYILVIGETMKTIAVSLQKGGVGKTSLAVSIAVELASFGMVLLIDADPQGNSSAWIGSETLEFELADVLLERIALNKAVVKTEVKNLFILPTAGLDGELKTFSEGQGRDDPFCFRRLVKEAAKLGFAYSVIDLSPGWSSLEKAAIIAADEVVTPVLGDSFALDGLQIFAENLKTLRKRMDSENPKYNKIVVNAIDGRIKQHGEIVSAIKDSAGESLKIYEIPVDPAFRLAQRQHISLQELSTAKPDTRQALKALAAAIKQGA
jgi:chromosome partitioning protein